VILPRRKPLALGGESYHRSSDGTYRNQESVNQNSSNWKAFYQDALLELDPEKMQQKIGAAQNAIADRVEDGLLHWRTGLERNRSGLQ
jgi:hypothetical protein